MDIGKAFSYVFEDPDWVKKVLIGGVLLIIPVVNLVVIGYMLVTLRNVAEGQPNPMPDWADFGAFFMKGLYAFIGVLVYFLPAIVLYCCTFVLQIGVASVVGGAGGREAGETAAGLVGLLGACLGCVVLLYSIFAGVTLYAPLTRFAMTENQLNVFWDFRGNFDFISKNLSNYLIALLVALVAGFVAQFGLILCVVGVLFTIFWSYMVSAYLFGQLWRNRLASAAG